MHYSVKSFFLIVLLAIVGLTVNDLSAQEQRRTEGADTSPEQSIARVPNLAEIIPLSAALTTQLTNLEHKLSGFSDMSILESRYAEIAANLQGPADQLAAYQVSGDYKYSKLLDLQKAIKRDRELYEKTNGPVKQAVSQLDTWRRQWLTKQHDWSLWRSSLLEEQQFEQLGATFEKADGTIARAIGLIDLQLEKLLAVQIQAGHVQVKMDTLMADIESLVTDKRYGILFDASPPMFTAHYISQFSDDWRVSIQRGIQEIARPDSGYFDQQGWIVLVQLFVSLVAIIAFYRNRKVLQNSARWQFLAARPISAGLFLTSIVSMVIYEYQAAFPLWVLVVMIVAGISFVRLTAVFVEVSWQKQFVFGLTVILIANRLMDLVNFPIPLFRLYMVFISLIGLIFCWRQVCRFDDQKVARYVRPLLRLGGMFLAVIAISNLLGKFSLASYLFLSLTDSIGGVLIFLLFMRMMKGGVDWLFHVPLLRRATVLYSDDTHMIISRVTRFMDITMWGLLLLPAVLMIWGIYDSMEEATKGLLGLGFNLESQRISVGRFIVALGIFYGAFLMSWILQKLFMDVLLRQRQVERGVRLSIERLIHYVILSVGFLIAISTLGIEISKITIMLSALGVGIGFGLQGVVNNFVSGLILLFERPVRVGDTIQIADKWAEIRRIGLRSTTIKTFDEADVIVPNSDLISNQVTNWTLSNRLVRLTIPVGVAYGSDIPCVMETLGACPKDCDNVVAYPPAQVLFRHFGESSLDFELRVWVNDADHRLTVTSQLLQEIDRRFREQHIEIAFPQRDLHLRSVDGAAIVPISQTHGPDGGEN